MADEESRAITESDHSSRTARSFGVLAHAARLVAKCQTIAHVAQSLLSSPAEYSRTIRRSLAVSFKSKRDLQAELADNRQDRVEPMRFAYEAMRAASDLITELWICRRLCDTPENDDDSASHRSGFPACSHENTVERQLSVAREPRDWLSLCGFGKAGDRHTERIHSAQCQTAGTALKAILQKHHARVRSGQDRLLDLRDF